MEDDEYLAKMSPKKADWQYHEICLWLPHKPETVDDIANDMVANGFRLDRAIATYEGKILDGRHRYEAAIKAGVDPIFAEFQGTKEEAIAFVTSENVARRHLNSKEKEYFYVQRAEALGVQERGGDRKSEEAKINPTFVGMVPSAKDHAEAIGVTDRTVERWEADRKEIKADQELAAKATTPEGYQEAKKVVKQRREKQKEAINNTVAPKVIDLNAIARSKKDTDIRSVGPAFVGLMETLCTKFDEKDIKRELVAFMHPDPLGLKTEALHKMADILSDLREDFSNETAQQQLN
jgi:ParB-like chromosome segregation protein Spo0J